MDPFQIALVDDHSLFRSGISALINGMSGYQIMFEAANGQDLMRKISPKFKPHIILLDINMPQMDGIVTANG
jgi:DNA-binding NarL/FixJ family response regulator